jgi:hypothetical protein
MIGLIALAALIVGSVLHFNDLGFKAIVIYWAIFGGAYFLAPLITGYGTLAIQALTVGVFYVHARIRAESF